MERQEILKLKDQLEQALLDYLVVMAKYGIRNSDTIHFHVHDPESKSVKHFTVWYSGLDLMGQWKAYINSARVMNEETGKYEYVKVGVFNPNQQIIETAIEQNAELVKKEIEKLNNITFKNFD